MRRLLYLAGDWLTQAALIAAAVACAAASVAPWGSTTIFQHIPIHVTGALFADGAIIIGASLLVMLLRRLRILGIVAALVMFAAIGDADRTVPRAIKTQIIQAQLTLTPVNRVLDQAHLPDINVGTWGQPDAQLLDSGLIWLPTGARYLLIASLVGLPFDPVVVFLWRGIGYWPCRRCKSWIAVRRKVDYCPNCGLWQDLFAKEPLRCPACRNMVRATDNFCYCCGVTLNTVVLENDASSGMHQLPRAFPE